MIPSRFLICVDSSGTAFDTMNIKHAEAFIPAALEVWPMTGRVAERFTAIEKAVNLFSSMRGINRYPGLVEVFDLLAAGFPGHPEIPDMTDLREFLVTETTYSYDTLKKWVKAHPSGDLEKVLAWSERADALFAEAAKGLKPYPLVRESLEIASRSATVAIVDGGTPEELSREWEESGREPFIDLMLSQADGTTAAQLYKARQKCGEKASVLMIGDTESDGAAAHKVGALFYPILPGDEVASWQRFHDVILPLFLEGKYDRDTEEKYFGQLKKLLS
ncbi:MAG: HAD hydrolase-like protein [Clostridia bacterium]|nr:HAD hydrolase-like protein [Clostridia bacterium]